MGKKCKLLNCVVKWMLSAGMVSGLLLLLSILIVGILVDMLEYIKWIEVWAYITILDIILTALLFMVVNWNKIRKELKCG